MLVPRHSLGLHSAESLSSSLPKAGHTYHHSTPANLEKPRTDLM